MTEGSCFLRSFVMRTVRTGGIMRREEEKEGERQKRLRNVRPAEDEAGLGPERQGRGLLAEPSCVRAKEGFSLGAGRYAIGEKRKPRGGRECCRIAAEEKGTQRTMLPQTEGYNRTGCSVDRKRAGRNRSWSRTGRSWRGKRREAALFGPGKKRPDRHCRRIFGGKIFELGGKCWGVCG